MITYTDVRNADAFASRHVAVAPLPYNRILCIWTGILIINFRGVSPNYWTKDVLRIGINPQPALFDARQQGWLEAHTPLPAGRVYHIGFRQEDIAPLVTINSVYNYDGADN